MSPGQEKEPKFEVNSCIGVFFFDKNLEFDLSPTVGLGAGYNFTNYLQLNLAFSYSPAQQRISTATSKLTTDIQVYLYSVNLRVSHPKPVLALIKPNLTLGLGGSFFKPQTVWLDLGGGQRIRIVPETDHKLSLNLGGGLMIQATKRLGVNLEYQLYLFRSNRVSDDGLNRQQITASNRSFGMRLYVLF